MLVRKRFSLFDNPNYGCAAFDDGRNRKLCASIRYSHGGAPAARRQAIRATCPWCAQFRWRIVRTTDNLGNHYPNTHILPGANQCQFRSLIDAA